MEKTQRTYRGAQAMIVTASFVVVVAGIRASASILVPFLLAAFIAIICAPLLFWMKRKGIPNALAVIMILIGIMLMGTLMTTLVGQSLNDFSTALPVYQELLGKKMSALLSWLKGLGIEIPDHALPDYFEPGKLMKMAANTLTKLTAALKNIFLILLLVIFILLEASGFPQKLQAMLGGPESLTGFNSFTESLNRFVAIKTLLSMATGVAAWILLVALGVDFPLLWGLLAFLLNFVPNIGSIIAAIPAVLLAWVQLDTSFAIMTCIGYVAINITVGVILEPKLMGRGLGLSPLIVFVSLVFWGWILGPVGMLLSVPLTMILKMALEYHDDTQWLAIMLGSVPKRLSSSAEEE